MIKTPRRFRKALALTWLFTGVSILFAVAAAFLPGKTVYSPQVAVLTATLIAILWYTYFTYCSVHQEQPTHLQLELAYPFPPFTNAVVLGPKVTNPTPRTVAMRIYFEVWWEKQPLDSGTFYRGDEEVTVSPYDSWSGSVDFGDLWRTPGTGTRERKLAVRLHATWRDDLNEEGVTPKRHYLADFQGQGVSAVIGASDIQKHFGDLPRLLSPAP